MNELGLVYTFYSYKGGVGRSMALANVAALLAKWGHRVLVVDWDLEAPGIEKFFNSPSIRLSSKRSTTPGITDVIYAHLDGKSLDWRKCIIKAASSHFEKELSILTAGRETADYVQKVQNIDWDHLFEKKRFGLVLEEMRSEWLSDYDFILVDSRTGITDIGGICTIHLPDIIILMFTTNRQSLDGVKDVINRARIQHRLLPFDRQTLIAVPVPARDESRTEYEKAAAWKKTFALELAELYSDWLPKNKEPSEILDVLRIPYIPYWSFGEKLPVIEEGTSAPESIGFSFQVLARTLAGKLSWDEIFEGPVRADKSALSEIDHSGDITMEEKGYVQQRLEDQIMWYDRSSSLNKKRFVVLSVIQVLCGLAIPFLVSLERLVSYETIWFEVALSLLGVSVALITGIMGIFKFQENWLNYRKTAEALKHERYLFLTKSSPYDFEDSFRILVSRVEALILKENAVWERNMEPKSRPDKLG